MPSTARAWPRWTPPTLAVVSGLYELFPSNQLVGNSLAGLADAVEDGGYLVYTGQPWHPQLEMIARALTSHRGRRGLGDAPPQPGRNGPVGGGSRLSAS
nr:class I SAM-dependent methyltransferase family protein [Pseudomonas peli]